MSDKPLSKKSWGEMSDDVIGFFSPLAAAKRRHARFVLNHMLGSYRGADSGRLRGSWIPGGGSADQDLLVNLPTLRERSRDLVRNDGVASGAIDGIVTNIIGSGIRPQSTIDREQLKISDDYADKLQRQIEKIWKRWVPYADACERMNFYQMEELSERCRFVNGESLVIPMRVTDSRQRRPYSFALQIVEADRLSTPTDYGTDKSVRSGIKLGSRGEPQTYFIRKTHPGDIQFAQNFYSATMENFVAYPAYTPNGDKNFFHLYHQKRAGQTRGEPFFSPAMNLFKDRFEYMEAELVANRVAACFAVFIKRDISGGITLSQDTEGKRVDELSPGMIENLRPGESIETFSPQRPGGTFGLFMERILRDVAASLNIPYEVLAKDFSKSNYSNTRAALLEARRFFMMQQDFIAVNLCSYVLANLIEEAYLRGELPILDFYTNREAYVCGRWIAPGWQWVDPQKEIEASCTAIDNNLSTMADEVASQGMDWEEVAEQRAREKKKIKDLEAQYGVSLALPDKSAYGAPADGGKNAKGKKNDSSGGSEGAGQSDSSSDVNASGSNGAE